MLITIEICPDRIRQLGSQALNAQMSSTQAEAFLLLYGAQLETELLASIREFVRRKLQ